jgi:FkbM family methyltransferase
MGETMQLSYAQNLEDYHLDLVFKEQQSGIYVDVGGGHPVADNVSFWFYLKGWRGLVVEPQERLAALYAGVRPRDHTVCCLAGRSDGEADFHVVDKLHGFSSMVKHHADETRQLGVDFKTLRRPVQRLDSLIVAAGLTTIDFLKIDVEGAEADVLAGLDLKHYRPRVIVIEAVEPGSMKATWHEWEPSLTSASYAFTFFDNLNRFYVAEEHADLKAHFLDQPAPWDRVAHLWDCGRAPDNPSHPDHALARILESGLLASLPTFECSLLQRVLERGMEANNLRPFDASVAKSLLGTAEFPRPTPVAPALDALIVSDQFRAALGRIACMYDGGHVVDG